MAFHYNHKVYTQTVRLDYTIDPVILHYGLFTAAVMRIPWDPKLPKKILKSQNILLPLHLYFLVLRDTA